MNFFDFLFNQKEYKDKGSTGERLTYRELTKGLFSKLFKKNHVFRNVYLEKEDGKLTEIDIIAVSNKGIFVIESKNYSGWIFGSEQNANWVQTLPNGFKTKFYNPIWQNNSHVKALKGLLKEYEEIKYFSMIVFSERCELKGIESKSENLHIIKRSSLNNAITKVLSEEVQSINDQNLEKIVKILSGLSRPEGDIKIKHLEDVQSTIEELQDKCPRCMGELKERKKEQIYRRSFLRLF